MIWNILVLNVPFHMCILCFSFKIAQVPFSIQQYTAQYTRQKIDHFNIGQNVGGISLFSILDRK